MINLLENLEDSFSNSFQSYNNNNFSLSNPKDNSFFLPLEETETSKKNKNLFITKTTMKEKIEHQKIRLGKESKEIFLDKKEDLKRRNRQSAQNSRNKKKLELMKLLEENKMLKDKIYMINCKLNLLCAHCKNFFEPNQIIKNNVCMGCLYTDNNNKTIQNNNSLELDENIFDNTHNTQSSSFFSNLKMQKLFNFMLIGLFSLLCIFCFCFYKNTNYTLRNNQEIINEPELKNISLLKNESLNNDVENIGDKIGENDFFNSFQCKKRSFASLMLDKFKDMDLISDYNNNNNDKSYKEKKSDNKIKNPIYFKLFVQSCCLDEEPENNNKDYNSFNENKHYIFSTDETTYRDFYFFCQKIDN